MKSFFKIVLLFCTVQAFSQQDFVLLQDSLHYNLKKIYSLKTDAEKRIANEVFHKQLEQALLLPGSFEFEFDSLKDVGRLKSPDNLFRIFCWNVPLEGGTFDYFGFIQVYLKKTNSFKVYKLINKSSEIKNQDNVTVDNNKWIGMLYYKIIPVKNKNKTYYTLLGWEGKDNLTTRKIIEVLTIAKDGTPKFGDAIFSMEKRSPKRVIFEYSEQASMSLRYDENNNVITFDHLAPSQAHLQGQYQYYGPDFSVDAFVFKKGKWVYSPDIDARNPKDKMDNFKPGDKKKEKKIYEPK